ncbi:ABC transporter substrate-binding protein [Propionibacterium sp.]|uniref:ABC transporter substrate-binding protein n=1 Tax=Propionibacterium sp. TaxID=1977903 RepID=UPI0039E7F502
MKFDRRSLLMAGALVALAGCSSANPVTGASSGSGASKQGLVVGSQQYYSNEIIAELYAQRLETSGFTVTRQYQIGQREVYLPEMEAGRIDVMPEYSGNLLQYYDKTATGTDPASVHSQLAAALPKSLRVLDAAEATDQDSYTVTHASADQYGLTSIGDLTKLGRVIKVAANSEFASRPYGPKGLESVYGVQATVVGVEDSGGPLTVKALTDGSVDAADIYTADPVIGIDNLVVLDDPKHLILPQNVTPLVTGSVDQEAAAAIDSVSAKLTTDQLRALNAQSTTKQQKSSDIAKAWLADHGLG